MDQNIEQRDQTSKDEDWIVGKVKRIDLKKNYGYILPDDTSKSDALAGKNEVRFVLNKAGWWVLPNDVVKFTLDTEKLDEPTVREMIRLRFAAIEKSLQTPPDLPTITSFFHKRSQTNPPCNSEGQNIETVPNVDDDVKRRTRLNFGTICSIETLHGYITPKNTSSYGVAGGENIFFAISDVRSENFNLMVEDEVSYLKKINERLRLCAFDVCPVKLERTDSKIFENYFEYLQSDFNSKLREGKIVLAIACLPIWQSFGNCQYLCDDAISTFNRFIIQLAKYDFLRAKVAAMLDAMLSTPLFKDFDGLYTNYVERMKHDRNRELLYAYRVMRIITRLVPYKAEAVLNLLKLNLSSDENNLDNDLHLLLLQHTKSAPTESLYDMDSNVMLLVPSVQELISGSLETMASLNSDRIIKPYASVHEYVDAYFRLLRAECFSALSKGVADLLNGKLDPRDMNVYTHVQFAGVHVKSGESRTFLGLKILSQRDVINWDQSCNLLIGNLLCISVTGTFRDNIWGTVVNRNLLTTHQMILVDLCSECNVLSDSEAILSLYFTNASTVMVESSTFYRMYQPILKSLRTMNPEELAFKEELVYCRFGGCPKTTSEKDEIDENFSTKFNALEARQKAVMKHCLEHRVAMVQGPPGTGKTLTVIKLAEILVSLWFSSGSSQTSEITSSSNDSYDQEHPPSTPIVIITYNSHSLNRILKKMLQISSDRVVCVGDRSEEQVISGCNLNMLTQKIPMSSVLCTRVTDLRSELENLESKVENSFLSLVNNIYFNVETLVESLSHDQIMDFLRNCNWSETNAILSSDSTSDKRRHRGAKKITQQKITAILNKCQNVHLELNSRESDSKLGVQLYNLLEDALKVWLPDNARFDEFDRHYNEHHGGLHTTYSRKTNIGKEPDGESDSQFIGEMDVEELLKERMAAMTKYSEHSCQDISESMKMLPQFFPSVQTETHNLNDSQPHLMKSAKELSMKLPLGILLDVNSIWELDDVDRIKLVQCLLYRQFEKEGKSFESSFAEYLKVYRAKEELENQHKVNVLREMKIVCMTLAGASIHCHLLSQLRPKIVIVEDAARVLEPQLIAVIGSWVQHLIMIGDYHQFRPSVTDLKLARDNNLNVSMMERLINNDLPHISLTMQYRMLPEFANLMLDIYPNLESNLPIVEKISQVNCLGKSVYFWDHEKLESACSSINDEEATRAVWLALFLIVRGNTPEMITILSPYFRQVQLIRHKVAEAKLKYLSILNKPSCENVIDVHTIDSYQGCVNDFVIISLVRSNKSGAVGLIDNLNLRCVAQSRARRGLYFIGNINTIMWSEAWKPLLRALVTGRYEGKTLQLHCPNHPEHCKWYVEDADNKHLTDSLCTLICGQSMACGRHTCKKNCLPQHSHKAC